MYLLYPVDTLAFRYKMSSAGLHYYHPYVPDSYFGYFIGKLSNREENIFCHLYAVDKNTIFVQNCDVENNNSCNFTVHDILTTKYQEVGSIKMNIFSKEYLQPTCLNGVNWYRANKF